MIPRDKDEKNLKTFCLAFEGHRRSMEDSREIGFISDEADDWCMMNLAYCWCVSQEDVRIKLPSFNFLSLYCMVHPCATCGVYLRIMQR